ncbi:MAG: hypothetical protein Tsb009_32050 [Planctomycetaceae bacterium]
MSRIASLGADQIRVLNRLSQIGKALSENTTRLSTLKRINSAKDDPAGLVKATVLERELSAAEATSQSLTRASALLSTADKTAGEIVTQLQSARTLILASIGSTVTSDEIAGNQIQVDTILRKVDSLAQTEFAGQQLLNGASGFRTSGVNSSEITDVDILDKATADDVTVSITINTQATQATNDYQGGTLTEDITLVVTGQDGSTTITLKNGDDTQKITDAFNAATYATGVKATRVDANRVDFTSVDYGTAATINIEATQGTFTLSTSGTVKGTDAVATINGQSVTGDGSVFSFNSSQISLVAEVDPTANGALTSFTATGEGLVFTTGLSPSSTARIGLPSLTTASLGGVTGKLHTILSGGTNTLTGGKAAEALKIVDDAIADATRAQAIVGGFQKFTIDSSSRVVDSTITNISSALSDIRDTDVALESAMLSKNQLLQQSAFQALSITSLNNRDVLSLLRTAAR